MLVLLSGGLDSAAVLRKAQIDYPNERHQALFISYGQRAHLREFQHCLKQCDDETPLLRLFIDGAFEYSKSALLRGGPDLFEGPAQQQLAEHRYINGVVEGRNGVLISLAISTAISVGATRVGLGIHATITSPGAFSDCSATFLDAMKVVAERQGIKLWSPFDGMTKSEVALWAMSNSVHIEDTYSCYRGNEEPCGKCSACLDRERAIALAKEELA
jgi:7-cyano-7-deazaguanine synthase